MPRVISSFALQEKNKLASGAAWFIALEILVPGVGTPIRVISNNESVTWRGDTWVAFPFDLGDISEESSGEVPRVELRVANASRSMEAYLQAYDLWQKTNGPAPITVTVYVICNQATTDSGVLTDSDEAGAVTEVDAAGAVTDDTYQILNPDPEAEFLFEVVGIRSDAEWATFSLGASNPFNKRYPMDRMLKNHCRFIFKGTLCGYSGAETTCNKTLSRCRALGNSVRFGGFPGIGMGGLRVAS